MTYGLSLLGYNYITFIAWKYGRSLLNVTLHDWLPDAMEGPTPGFSAYSCCNTMLQRVFFY
jgi:hypothetical protein